MSDDPTVTPEPGPEEATATPPTSAGGDGAIPTGATIPGADPGAGEPAEATTISVEDLVVDLERVSQERNDYLDALRRLQAEFENYRKAVAKRESDARERANEGLVGEMLPVLDACDAAVDHGAEDVAPIRSALLDTLTKQGLERIEPVESAFDPERHEAVMHEPSDEPSGPTVTQVLRVGYAWRGRTVRPAMVRVRG